MTRPSIDTDPKIARAREAAYGLIAHGFQYPDRALVDMLADPTRWDGLSPGVPGSSWPDVLRKVDPEAAGHLDAVRELLLGASQRTTGRGPEPARTCGVKEIRATPQTPAALQEAYNDLFGHAVRGRCPPYELEYARGEIIQLASSLADIAGFFAAFGMEIGHDADDRADHITVECEFMSVLCAKEALAIEEGDADHLDITTAAQRDFLQDHLARWLPAFAHRVEQACPRTFYGGLARFAAAFIAGECRRLEIDVGPPTLELRPTDAQLDTSISCGATGDGDELIQINQSAGQTFPAAGGPSSPTPHDEQL